MAEPARCLVCRDPLPDHDFPGATTCREWADAAAARIGDALDEDTYRRLMVMRAMCQLYAALRDGRETIDEP
jgi:hypothetical protein